RLLEAAGGADRGGVGLFGEGVLSYRFEEVLGEFFVICRRALAAFGAFREGGVFVGFGTESGGDARGAATGVEAWQAGGETLHRQRLRVGIGPAGGRPAWVG